MTSRPYTNNLTGPRPSRHCGRNKRYRHAATPYPSRPRHADVPPWPTDRRRTCRHPVRNSFHPCMTRATVYRHFPDDESLIIACSNQWLSCQRLPNPDSWAVHDDPLVRLRAGLADIYRYYRAGELASWRADAHAHRPGRGVRATTSQGEPAPGAKAMGRDAPAAVPPRKPQNLEGRDRACIRVRNLAVAVRRPAPLQPFGTRPHGRHGDQRGSADLDALTDQVTLAAGNRGLAPTQVR